MMNNDMIEPMTDIERNVMRRVRIMRILGLIISTAVLALLTFILTLWGIGQEVWVERVFSNGPQDILGRAFYLLYAFGHTRLIVQALSIITFVSFLYILRATIRAIVSFFSSTHT
jgi:hypothetical protein